jgi:hypothetical protein
MLTGAGGVVLEEAPAVVENKENKRARATRIVIAREVVLIVIRPLQVGLVLIAMN